jgi:hypothetical protein
LPSGRLIPLCQSRLTERSCQSRLTLVSPHGGIRLAKDVLRLIRRGNRRSPVDESATAHGPVVPRPSIIS